ncbi:hypothetical protein ABK045_20370 [Stenotrophomonas pavanii]|uniref:hypothetical protein n=1 Tax=Stenotrophomonas TaxID=40323 RepID=UPI0021C95B3B|nr:hypothetical protein [Stenotrophomonas sp. Sm5341]MCU1123565.1 hypothetical protein [Stenotrophomonas maltophilia]MDQ7285864.1 hypothetical protein [Stenotrophomonas sp. Sm5341]
MRHLALPFFCVICLGVAFGEALANGITSRFGVAFMGATLLWGVITCIELRAAWPPFAAEMQRRRAERQPAPLPADDTH